MTAGSELECTVRVRVRFDGDDDASAAADVLKARVEASFREFLADGLIRSVLSVEVA